MPTVVATEHPHVVRREDTCGGEPIVQNTRTTVRAVVGYYRIGMTPEEILEGLPHLTAAQVYDALSFYHDHTEEIERYIEANRIEKVTKKLGMRLAVDGRLVPDDSAPA